MYMRTCNRCNKLLEVNIVDEVNCGNCGGVEFRLIRIPLMKYMIVFWSDSKWNILHYSHHYQDAVDTFEKFTKSNPGCQLMFDYRDLAVADARVKFFEMQKMIQEKLAKLNLPKVSLDILKEDEDAEDED